MDACNAVPGTGRTQQLLAERLRQRYARCRESLASRSSESPVQAKAVDASPLRPVAWIANGSAASELPPTASAERFSTLFSQAYSAARESQDNALAVTLDRGRQHAAA